MAKYDEYVRGRADGMSLALSIVEKYGIDGLREEIKFRNQTGVKTSLAVKELDAASQKIKEMTVDTMTVLSILTLNQKFGFGAKRSQTFLDGLTENADEIIKEMSTWQDCIKRVEDKVGIKLKIRMNN